MRFGPERFFAVRSADLARPGNRQVCRPRLSSSAATAFPGFHCLSLTFHCLFNAGLLGQSADGRVAHNIIGPDSKAKRMLSRPSDP